MSGARPAGGVIPPTPNPYVYDSGGDNNDNHIVVEFYWGPITRLIVSITTHRDVGCDWSHIFVGLGPDGSPNTSPRQWSVPEGDTNMIQNLLTFLATNGLSTIDDLLTNQITAG